MNKPKPWVVISIACSVLACIVAYVLLFMMMSN